MNYPETTPEVPAQMVNTIDPSDPFSAHRRNYLLVKSSKIHLLNDYTDSQDFYQRIIDNQLKTDEEGGNLVNYLDQFEPRGYLSVFEEARSRPFIFCPFHLGSFHSWPTLFSRFGVDFSAAINMQAFTNLKARILRNLDELNAVHQTESSLTFIDAEDPKIAIQMIRELKANRSLFIYIDGNSGVGGNKRTDEKLDTIQFLHARYRTRTGIAAISHLTGTPIVPLVSYRENGKIVQEVLPPIIPDRHCSREAYAKLATQKIYDCLVPFLERYPDQWEPWLYINHHIEISKEQVARLSKEEPQQDHTGISFNKQRYGLLAEADKFYLFDTYSTRLFTISKGLFSILNAGDSTVFNQLSTELLNDLLANAVLYSPRS